MAKAKANFKCSECQGLGYIETKRNANESVVMVKELSKLSDLFYMKVSLVMITVLLITRAEAWPLI